MAKNKYNSQEKSIWKKGFFAGLFSAKKKKTKPVPSTKKKGVVKRNSYFFTAFNDNCDVFNVEAISPSRKEALANARRILKRDPEIPDWKVTITEDNANPDNYRKITVYDTGVVHDNWRPHYRSEDDAIRKKYPNQGVVRFK